MRVISCRPPSHPSLPEAEGAEGVKGGSGRGKGQGHAGGRAGSEVKLGSPKPLHWSCEDPSRDLVDAHTHTRAHTQTQTRTCTYLFSSNEALH